MFDTIADMLRGSAPDDLAHALGTDRTQTRRAMEIGLPALITGLRDKTLEPGGAQDLAAMLDSSGADLPDDTAAYLAKGDPSQGAALLDVAFGDRGEPALGALSEASGLSTRLLAQVMSVLAPLATGVLGQGATRTPDGIRSYLSDSVADLESKGFGRVVELVTPELVAEAPASPPPVVPDEPVVEEYEGGTVVEGAFPDASVDVENELVSVPPAPTPIVTVPGDTEISPAAPASPDYAALAVDDSDVSIVPDAAPPLPGDQTFDSGKGISSMGWIWMALAAIVALGLLVFALSRCGSGDDPATTTDTAATPAPAAEPTPDPQVQVRQTALDQVLVNYPGVSGEVIGTVAVLNGAVADDRTKALLDQDARAVAGMTGVQNNVTVNAASEPEGYTVNDIVAAQSELSTFKALLDEAGIGDALGGNGPFTVFAPTNDAFAALGDSLAEVQSNRDALQAVMAYHVVPGTLDAAQIASMASLTTQQGELITVTADGAAVRLNDSAGVRLPDVAGRNGILHIIDGVLLPPSAAPAPPPEELGAELQLAPVTFSPGSADLLDESKLELDRVVEYLLASPLSIEIGGHTDSDGEESLNLTLSQDRAQAVKDYLVGQGIPTDSLTAVGYGEANPVASNDSADGKAANRRIEFRPN